MSAETLVIGGAGFIGSRLVPQLLATGRKVSVLGRRAVPEFPLPEDAAYLAGDFSDADLIARLLDSHREVVHLAHATMPNTSFDNPLGELLQNLHPTERLYREAARRGVRLLLVSSGGTVYGEATQLPIVEDMPTRPISPYGVTKLTLENYARLHAVAHGLDYVCVRPANAYGPGQRPFAGQGFVSTAMASVLQGKPVLIFGARGTVRDYVYVDDLAAAIVCALEKGRPNETYNIGSGTGLSNLDVIEAMMPLMQELGIKVRVEHAPERAYDVKANVLDASKLRAHAGWLPAVDVVDGLRRTCDWLRQRANV